MTSGLTPEPVTRAVDAVEAAGAAPAGPSKARRSSRSPRREFLRRVARPWVNRFALAVLLLWAFVALLAPWLAPVDPIAQDLTARRLPPLSDGHLLGTDSLGRDTLSRLMYGARVAAQAALTSVAVGLLFGVPPGLVAGLLRGWWDAVLSRVADALLSFPPLLLALAIVGVMGPNLTNAMLAIGVVFVPRFYRVTRAATLAIREETYIEASRSIGTPTSWVLRHHVVPNVVSPLAVQISLALGFAILAESSLSFLGLGVQPPAASWGSMLAEGRAAWFYTSWPVIVPAVTIVTCVLACNVLGDGIADSVGRDAGKGR
ncbi:ABC transporter permease [Nocardioides massiliensis]|uniref:Peptide/nickel transport system permease protein n=1 Tax=Nocardioides massiliensis TaxID=1325935 RepID=A0ABT9NK99_9ACTN|nr:ABC transporter permease [Nocardioides massiliensis]MDP9820843.1 peptide/nickel transport system permease protein [Nocardioides massiliensis]